MSFNAASGTRSVHLISINKSSPSAFGFALTGGSLTALQTLVGDEREGSFSQTGGELTTALWLGNGAGVSGKFTLSGDGVLNSQSASIVGFRGTGTFVQTGGTHIGTQFVVASQSGSSGTYLLAGGTFRTYNLDIGMGGTGSFEQIAGITAAPLRDETFEQVGRLLISQQPESARRILESDARIPPAIRAKLLESFE